MLANKQTPQLLQHLFDLLRVLARDNSTVQSKLLQHADLFLSYLSIADVDVATIFTATVLNNADIIKKKGKEWCKIILAEVSKRGQLKSVHLELIISLLSCNGEPVKDIQDFVRAEIQSSSELENMLVPGSMMAEASDVSQFDPVKDSNDILIESNCLLLLARVCQGKNPASNVFAERFVSLEWLINSIVKIPRSWDNTDVCYRYKRALLTCLRHVYLHADFSCIEHQVKLLETGFWTLDADWYPDANHCQPLVPMLRRELSCFALALTSCIKSAQPLKLKSGHPDLAIVSETEGEVPEIESEQTRVLTSEYQTFIISCLKLLHDYYRLPPFEMPERSRHYRITQALLCQVEALISLLQRALLIRQSDKGTIDFGVGRLRTSKGVVRSSKTHGHFMCTHCHLTLQTNKQEPWARKPGVTLSRKDAMDWICCSRRHGIYSAC